MSTTPKRGWFYPDGSVTNDYPLHMEELAAGLDVVPTDSQGPLESRRTTGNTSDGQYYFATTRIDPYSSSSAVVPWNVLYRWNGSAWVQLNDSAIQTYRPVWSLEAGAGFSLSLFSGVAAPAEYQVKAGGKCWLNLNQLLTLNGTPGIAAVYAGLPINASSYAGVAATAQNRPPEVGLNDDLDVVEFHSGDYANGQVWQTNTSIPLWFRATTEYRIG